MTLTVEAAAETYHDVEIMIQQLAWRAYRGHGGSLEDYVSAANEAFVDAYLGFDPTKGVSFTTHLWWMVRKAFEVETRRRRQLCGDPAVLLEDVPDRHHSDFEAVIGDLSYDAQVMVQLIMDSAKEFTNLLRHDKREVIWHRITKKLIHHGWSVMDIIECFSEIREALS